MQKYFRIWIVLHDCQLRKTAASSIKESGLGAADFDIKPISESVKNTNCPKSISGFENGQSNLFVKNCLGKPSNIDQNPDGRYIYFYYRPKGVVPIFRTFEIK